MPRSKKTKKTLIMYELFVIVMCVTFLLTGCMIRKCGYIEPLIATDVLPYIFGLFSLGCLLFFPSVIVGALEDELFKKNDYRLTKEVFFVISQYILNIIFLTAFIYFCTIDDFLPSMTGFYSLSNHSTPIMSLLQIMTGIVFNTVLLGLLLTIFQSRISNKNVSERDAYAVSMKLENESYILEYELKSVIKKIL